MKCLSPCKINLSLNILSRRPDGFHDLESILWPVALFDALTLQSSREPGISLTVQSNLDQEDPIPVDASNLVLKAAHAWSARTGIDLNSNSLEFALEKNIPSGAGLGGGSGNAAVALLMINKWFDHPCSPEDLWEIAASLGSDIPFFLQSHPALVTGRGEILAPFKPHESLKNAGLFIAHPGFGISTGWVYNNLKRFPEAMDLGHGKSLSQPLRDELAGNQNILKEPEKLESLLLNSLEAPVLPKYPILKMFLEFYKSQAGYAASKMSGSGSSTFAICDSLEAAQNLKSSFNNEFGSKIWSVALPLIGTAENH